MGKKCTFGKVVLLHKSKSWSIEGVQKSGENTNRILISINILGSSGPLLIVVKEETIVSHVIEIALKCYARHGRLPVLGSDATQFVLYSSNVVSQALCPSELIGSFGTRKFVLCEKESSPKKTGASSKVKSQKGNKSWKKSFSFKIHSVLSCAIG